jgi:hypothetical protein
LKNGRQLPAIRPGEAGRNRVTGAPARAAPSQTAETVPVSAGTAPVTVAVTHLRHLPNPADHGTFIGRPMVPP